jgi:predicted nucleotidyltransferase
VGTPTNQPAVQDAFAAALDAVVEDVKRDRSVLAAILCGSLAHDAVWEKSDIDLVLVTIDDRLVPNGDAALYADGLNIHALLVPRSEFRKAVEGSIRNSFLHSFLAKGRLLYTHDPSIEALCATLRDLGDRDRKVQLFQAATCALPPVYKAHKWFVTRGDLDYTALWILYAATPLARVEVIGHGLLADREVIPQALALNPAFFERIYTDLFNAPKTRERVLTALDAVDRYLADRAGSLFAPVIEHLKEVGEARSSTDIEDHFQRNMGVAGATTACEYLADQRLLGKASIPRRLTKRSHVDVQELAFFHVEPPSTRDRA